jgi:ABC-2 type transport system permease protein
LYLSVFLKNLKQQIQYRSEFILRIAGSMLFVYIQICIWQALLSSQSGTATAQAVGEMVTYVIVAYLLRQISRTDFTSIFNEKVNKGDIAIDLIRPISLKHYLFAEQFSENACVALFSCLPVAVISFFIWGFSAPTSVLQLLLFIISSIFAVLLMFYFEIFRCSRVFRTAKSTYTRHCEWLTLFFPGPYSAVVFSKVAGGRLQCAALCA